MAKFDPENSSFRLTGKAAEQFWEYDSRPLTAKEKKELKEAHEFYKSHCK